MKYLSRDILISTSEELMKSGFIKDINDIYCELCDGTAIADTNRRWCIIQRPEGHEIIICEHCIIQIKEMMEPENYLR